MTEGVSGVEGVEALRLGAEDYLPKYDAAQGGGYALRRCVLYAIERQRLHHELAESRRREAVAREQAQQEIDRRAMTTITQPSLSSPVAAEEIDNKRDQYAALVKLYLDNIKGSAREKPLDEMLELIQTVRHERWSAKDLVRLHIDTVDFLTARLMHSSTGATRTWQSETRVMLIELLVRFNDHV